MQINATFIIQIVNFWIMYVVLHKIILKPSVKLIASKMAAKKTMIDALKDKELLLLRLQDEKKKHLSDFKTYMKTAYQLPTPQVHEIMERPACKPNPEELERLVKTTKDLLIEKAGHAY